MRGKARSVVVLALCVVAALALWFSATAVVPELRAEFGISASRASLFTSFVQAGFVVGTIISALLILPDRVDPRRLFMSSALVASAANALIVLLPPGSD